MKMVERCPKCGQPFPRRRSPAPTVDIIIEIPLKGIVLIQRSNPPLGWALPGGYVDYGESLEGRRLPGGPGRNGLKVELLGQLHTYSDPRRDPRQHNISTVFVARAMGSPKAADDARSLAIFFGWKIYPRRWPSITPRSWPTTLRCAAIGWLNLRNNLRLANLNTLS